MIKLAKILAVSSLLILASCQGENFSTQASNNAQSIPPNTPPTNNPIPAVSCSVGNNSSPQETQSYPTSCLANPGLPPNASGFEMNNLTNAHVTLNANNSSTGTQNGVFLYVEIATYEEPDTIIINAISTTGQTTELLYICNYSTDTEADPTNPQGTERPYSDTILPFNVKLPVGTAQITISVDENTPYNSGSPTYIGVWNLNEFSSAIQGVPTTGLGTSSTYNFRPQSAPLSKYNDQGDKNNPAYPNYCVGSP